MKPADFKDQKPELVAEDWPSRETSKPGDLLQNESEEITRQFKERI